MVIRYVLLTAVLMLVSGCAAFFATKPPEPVSVECRYTLPDVNPVEGYQELQEKSGVKISAAMVPFTPERNTKDEYRKKDVLFISNEQYPFEVKKVPYYTVSPGHVLFKLRVVNGLDRVLRMAGAVISFTVNGKAIALDRTGYDDFLAGTILPRQEMEYEIKGPAVSTISDSSVVSLLIYDVVTKTDPAGNPTEKSNFEWYYVYNPKNVTQSEEVSVSEVYMTKSEAMAKGIWTE